MEIPRLATASEFETTVGLCSKQRPKLLQNTVETDQTPISIFDKKQQYYDENGGVYALILLLKVKKAEDDKVVTRLLSTAID